MFKQEVFIERLVSMRKSNKMSQADLGAHLGISKQAVNEIEKCRMTTTLERLALIADLFNVSTDYLLGRTDNPVINK